MNFRTISQLPQSKRLDDGDLLEISKLNVRNNNDGTYLSTYQSFRIDSTIFSEAITGKALGILSSDEYGFGRQHNLMWNWLTRIVNSDLYRNEIPIDLNGNITFTNEPKSNNVISSFSSYDLRMVNVETLKYFSTENSPLFIDKDATFNTSYFNVENNLTLSSNEAPSLTSEKHNQYLFRITNTTSNIWKATDSGIFTCYGWVDEATEGPPDNSRRWVALEGKIDNEWKILQVQAVIPNVYCSYVSFTFPVGKGLELRLKTGFKVGTNSNKYQSTQGSLTNHIANAFIGGIYKSGFASTTTYYDQSGKIINLTGIDKLADDAKYYQTVKKINEIIEVLTRYVDENNFENSNIENQG